MKSKIVILCSIFTFFSLVVFAQQAQTKVVSAKHSEAINPNIERMRIVNQKLAAEKAATSVSNKIAPAQKNREEVARFKATNREASKSTNQQSATSGTISTSSSPK